MAVKSLKDYESIHRDTQDGFGPVQILYFCWEGHMLFAASMALVGPPEMKLGDLIETQLKNILQIDPDAANIDWNDVQWFKKGEQVELDYDKSLAENGLKHKHQIVLKTPGLNTLCGAAA
jgi:phenol hydroxylase P4 protein